MNISFEEKKTEAISRMKTLGIFPETIKQFEKGDYVSRSEPPFGAYYWVEGDELDALRKFEQAHNCRSSLHQHRHDGQLPVCK